MDLLSLKVLALDCQTTGATPDNGEIIQISWQLKEGNISDQGCCTHFLRTERPVPKHIVRLTGITDDILVEKGLDPGEVAAELKLVMADADVWLAHYARFEARFLEAWAASYDLPLKQPICTYEISRRLFPGLPSRSLKSVAGHLGLGFEHVKSSDQHVAATLGIWEQVISRLSREHMLSTWEDLEDFLGRPPERSTRRFHTGIPEGLRLGLASVPGVYQFYDAGGRILYIGKATSLKSRVNSYFVGRKSKGRKNELITLVKDIRAIACDTALEAALLENDLIKTLAPPYNHALRPRKRALNELLLAGTKPLVMINTPKDFAGLVALCQGEAGTIAFADCQDETMISEAVHSFRRWVGDPVSGCFGRAILRRGLEMIRIPPDEDAVDMELENDDELNADTSSEVTPDKLCRRLIGMSCRIAKYYWRERWLVRIGNSVISFKKGARKRRVLQISAGKVNLAVSLRAADSLPPVTEDDITFDQQTYDRLRILITELWTLLDKGYDVTIDTRDGRFTNTNLFHWWRI